MFCIDIKKTIYAIDYISYDTLSHNDVHWLKLFLLS